MNNRYFIIYNSPCKSLEEAKKYLNSLSCVYIESSFWQALKTYLTGRKMMVSSTKGNVDYLLWTQYRFAMVDLHTVERIVEHDADCWADEYPDRGSHDSVSWKIYSKYMEQLALCGRLDFRKVMAGVSFR